MGYDIFFKEVKFHMKKEKINEFMKKFMETEEWKDFKKLYEEFYSSSEPLSGTPEMLFAQYMKYNNLPVFFDKKGNINDIDYTADNYWGSEIDDILATIAPYVDDGSFIEVYGEDCERWRWVFKNGKIYLIHPEIIWKEP